MRAILALAVLTLPVCAEWTLYSCVATTKNWVVGTRVQASGVFRRSAGGEWTRVGYMHPITNALDYARNDPATMYLAAGNGVIRLVERGGKWRILTGHDVTEIRDVAVDPSVPGTIYFAHTAGIRHTRDAGATWRELRNRFTETVRVDRTRSGVLVAGGEDGIWRSEDGGASWRLSGAPGFQIMTVEQSPHEPCVWLAGTQGGGLFRSDDCGVSFENSGNIAVGRNLYRIAFDPTSRSRIALAGWALGVAVSEDGGKTWTLRNNGLPSTNIRSVVFDPEHSGRLFASAHEEALYVSNDAGAAWTKDGLEGSVITHLRFVPEPAK
jgi:photosystem II stability/assembly factor-like uncharacterized protein